MAAKFNPPKEFDFLPENWPEWISRWSRFRTVSKLNTEEEGVQIDSLIYSMGTRAESIFSSLGLGEDEVGVYNAVKKAFEEYFAHVVISSTRERSSFAVYKPRGNLWNNSYER